MKKINLRWIIFIPIIILIVVFLYSVLTEDIPNDKETIKPKPKQGG